MISIRSPGFSSAPPSTKFVPLTYFLVLEPFGVRFEGDEACFDGDGDGDGEGAFMILWSITTSLSAFLSHFTPDGVPANLLLRRIGVLSADILVLQL